MKNSELFKIGAIYVSGLMTAFLLSSNYHIKKDNENLKQQLLDVKSLVVEYDKTLDDAYEMVNSLNLELDTYMHLERLKNDLGK